MSKAKSLPIYVPSPLQIVWRAPHAPNEHVEGLEPYVASMMAGKYRLSAETRIVFLENLRAHRLTEFGRTQKRLEQASRHGSLTTAIGQKLTLGYVERLLETHGNQTLELDAIDELVTLEATRAPTKKQFFASRAAYREHNRALAGALTHRRLGVPADRSELVDEYLAMSVIAALHGDDPFGIAAKTIATELTEIPGLIPGFAPRTIQTADVVSL